MTDATLADRPAAASAASRLPALLGTPALALPVLGVLILAGFWPTYLSRIARIDSWRTQLHGAAMGGWFLLMLGQAWLVRTGRRPLHRALGRLSYAWVPFVVATTVSMAHHRIVITKAPDWPETLYFLWIQLGLLALFAGCWAMAMVHRKRPLVHARYMVGTALTLVDPALARLLWNVGRVDWPAEQVVTYALIDAILAALAWWDAKRTGSRVFAGLLLAFVLFELPTFWVWRLPAWRAFADAFGAWPMP